jgi:broad specificity phosphatase PhoE
MTTTRQPARPRARRTITTVVALGVSALLAGCGTGGDTGTGAGTSPGISVATGTLPWAGAAPRAGTGAEPESGEAVDDVAVGTVVMVIRHGEKPEGSEPGVDAAGNPDDSSMTETGWERAHGLVDLFAPAQGDPRPGLARPAAIYAAGANKNGEGARTRETVQPLAAHLGLTTNTTFGKGDEEELVEHVLTQPGPTLISWAHSEIPTIVESFPEATPTPPGEWPEDRFDVVWTFTLTAEGWSFAQLPELVLPQDENTVIEDVTED